MRIVFISDWFAEKMGYSENCLPKAIGSLGHQVDVITSNLQPYFNSPIYKKSYEAFIGPAIVPCMVKDLDGFRLRRLPSQICRGRLRIKGLLRAIAALRPQIVQTFEIESLTTYEAALAKPFLDYGLFLESHTHASVFAMAEKSADMGARERLTLYPNLVAGKLVSLMSDKCYAISVDAAQIAVRFFGIEPHKISVCPLGVDADIFRPLSDQSLQEVRTRVRRQLGFADSDIVCIYTGRLSHDKDPLCLAQAIEILAQQDMRFHGLFIGDGPQAEYVRVRRGCVVKPFVPYVELPPYYWAADIGVWPKQESTSQLDAAACGIPIILSNRVKVRERFDGNGLTYREGDSYDLALQIRVLGADLKMRRSMGERGAKKMSELFSWRRIAKQRLRDYETALGC